MDKFETLDEVAKALGDGGPFAPDATPATVDELVNMLVDLGNIPKVFVSHDDHLGLKDNLSPELLNTAIDEVNPEPFEDEVREILDNANRIIPLSKREMTDDLEDAIREDEASRGYNRED